MRRTLYENGVYSIQFTKPVLFVSGCISVECSSDLTSGSLPSRYSLVPLPAAGEQVRVSRSRTRGSLPDVSASVAPTSAAGFMSREEVQLLSQNMREERRLLREEDERRRKFELILNIGSLRVIFEIIFSGVLIVLIFID